MRPSPRLLAPPTDAPQPDFIYPGALGEAPPWGQDGGGGGACSESRIALAGGMLNALIVDPLVVPFERLYRRLPEEGMFLGTVNPERPVVQELGAFTTGDGQQGTYSLLIFDMSPNVFRFSGLDPGDTVPVENQRFSSIMGFDVLVDGQHTGNYQYELQPVPATFGADVGSPLSPAQNSPIQSEVPIPLLPGSSFDIGRATSFANPAGAGTSLQPQRPRRAGALSVPFTLIVGPNQTIQLRAVIFRPVRSPIAYIEYSIAGMLMPAHYMQAIQSCMKPISNGPLPAATGPYR